MRQFVVGLLPGLLPFGPSASRVPYLSEEGFLKATSPPAWVHSSFSSSSSFSICSHSEAEWCCDSSCGVSGPQTGAGKRAALAASLQGTIAKDTEQKQTGRTRR